MNDLNTHRLSLSDASSSLTVEGGELVLLGGDIGSGKSLWLKRIAELTTLPSGFHIKKTATSSAPLRLLFDHYPPLWLGQTVREELNFGLKQILSHEEMLEILQQWHIPSLALDCELITLNRLQALRLALATIEIASPSIILLDNPTDALPAKAAQQLGEEIQQLAQRSNSAIVVTSNRWQDWQPMATQVWSIDSPDQLPLARSAA